MTQIRQHFIKELENLTWTKRSNAIKIGQVENLKWPKSIKHNQDWRQTRGPLGRASLPDFPTAAGQRQLYSLQSRPKLRIA
jgi:hypothetical protein